MTRIDRVIGGPVLLLLSSTLIVAGCATTPPPTETVSKAELAVEEAGEGKAPDYAPVELRQARRKLDRAQQAMDDEKHDKARRLAEEALVDAQVAEAKAEAQRTHQILEELRKSIESLREQIDRAQGTGQSG